MRITVTGATGLVGNNVVRRALARGWRVRAALRASSPVEPLADLDVEAARGDLHDPAFLRRCVRGSDFVVHAAALIHIGWTRVEESRRVNVELTRRVAEACGEAGVRLVHVSTVDALAAASPGRPAREADTEPAKPPCAYVVSKREAEVVVRDQVRAGLDAVIARPGFLLGPWDWKPSSGRMLRAVARARLLLAPGGGCSVADVRGVADALLEAGARGRPGASYVLAGTNLTYLELWRLMAEAAGRCGPRATMPDALAEAVGRAGDLAGRLLGRELGVNSAATRMGQLHHYYDSGRAVRELGYDAGEVRTAIRDAWRWLAGRAKAVGGPRAVGGTRAPEEPPTSGDVH